MNKRIFIEVDSEAIATAKEAGIEASRYEIGGAPVRFTGI